MDASTCHLLALTSRVYPTTDWEVFLPIRDMFSRRRRKRLFLWGRLERETVIKFENYNQISRTLPSLQQESWVCLRCYKASVLQALDYTSRRGCKPWVVQTLGAKIPRCKKHWVLGCYESWALQNLQPSRLEGFAKQGTRVLTERRRLAKSASS